MWRSPLEMDHRSLAALRALLTPALSLGALALGAGCGAPFPPQQSIVVRRPAAIYGAHLEQPRPVGAYRKPEDAPPEVDGFPLDRCQALCGDVLPGRTVLSCRDAVLDASLARIDPEPPKVIEMHRPGMPSTWTPNEWILCSFTPAAPSSSAQESPR